MIGINEWLIPQISEHCPQNNPGRLQIMLIWFNRPGQASIFNPNLGTLNEWITSIDEINNRIFKFIGIIKCWSVSNKRKFNLWKFEIINESKFNLFIKSEYSNVQYHWCPIILIVILVL